MSDRRAVPLSVRRVVGYVLAATAGALFTVVVFRLASYFGRPLAGHNLSRCVAGGAYGWIGAGLILLVVGALALYLGRLGRNSSGGNGAEAVQARCVSCGHVMGPDWKICPHCGGLAGRTRHARDIPTQEGDLGEA